MDLAWRRRVAALLLCCAAVGAAVGASAAMPAGNYTPTPQEVADVDARTDAYFKAMSRADFRRAYLMLAPAMQAMFPLPRWKRLGAEANALHGKHFARQRTAVTWMLDPPDAAGPGLYAMIDFQDHSDSVPLQSEYLIWQRAPGESEFRLLRQEQASGSAARKASGSAAAAEPSPPSPPSPDDAATRGANDIGYATVAEARAALATKAGATVTDTAEGWRIVVEGPPPVVWSFTPAGHAAFPSVVRRAAVERDGGVAIDMSVLCEAARPACEQLVRDFQAMNKRNAEEIQ